MRNPLESEETAFRFVLGTIVYLAPIVAAAWIATWLGVIVFVAMSVLAFVVLKRRATPQPVVVSTERAAVEDTRRILVVTDAVAVGPRLQAAITGLVENVTEDVLLICAVPPSPASADAPMAPGSPEADQLETALQALRAAGTNVRGTVVAAEPLSALEDALRRFDADEVVISSGHRREIADAIRSRFGGPVTAVTEDGAR